MSDLFILIDRILHFLRVQLVQNVLAIFLLMSLTNQSVLLAQTNAPTSSAKPVTLFWMNNQPSSVDSFLAHKDKIGIISPTWYQIDENGLVSGEPQPVVLKAAKEAHVTLLPLFALFNPEKAHQLINNQKAQDEMNRAFVRECKENGYEGINYDIEDVMSTDRDGLTAMVKKTADVLHQQHLLLTIDVVPGAPGHAGETDFSRWIFTEWRGAYDLQALGEAVDILCLMTYDQSTRWTTPGPVGGWDWTNKNLEYALQVCTFTEAFARYRGLWIPLVHRRSGREQKGQGVQRDRGLHLPAHRRLCPRPAYVVSSHRSRSGRAPGL